MNRDDIIRMVREAGMREGDNGDWTAADAALTYPECVYTENLERFANLVAAAEREACAKLCRSIADYFREHKDDMPPDLFDPVNAVLECDIAIRKRGAL